MKQDAKILAGVLLLTIAMALFLQGKAFAGEEPETLKVSAPFDGAYDTILDFFKRKGHTLDAASRKDLGQIITNVFDYKGGMTRDSALKNEVLLIKENENEITIIVAVTNWVQQAGLPWYETGINAKKSSALASEIKDLFGQPK